MKKQASCWGNSMSDSKSRPKIIFMYAVLGFLILTSVALGRYKISLSEVLFSLFAGGRAQEEIPVVYNIIFKVRLPRILASVLIGSALSAAGASYQGIFKNPMVSPSLLGVSSGAGFGAAIAILLDFKAGMIQAMAFIFGIAAVTIVYFVSRFAAKKMDRTLTLILTGVVISSAFTSLISLLKYVGDPYDDLPEITFWLLGSISDVSMKDALVTAIPVVLGLAVLFLIRWKINIMTLDEDEAVSLGIETHKLSRVIILVSTVITASVVSISGMISWVGLVIPHLARMIVGPDYKRVIPASFAIGAIFMLILDDISRVCFAAEIPLGILTSMIGTPFFLYLMLKGRKSW
ncbi:MAG: iron ABC transporter permease [Clostridia bacterium]|nr:iron ABC transporter permease [Clostridia bacterium]